MAVSHLGNVRNESTEAFPKNPTSKTSPRRRWKIFQRLFQLRRDVSQLGNAKNRTKMALEFWETPIPSPFSYSQSLQNAPRSPRFHQKPGRADFHVGPLVSFGSSPIKEQKGGGPRHRSTQRRTSLGTK
jgi:hypothetical protein